jgi:hypothetical protein
MNSLARHNRRGDRGFTTETTEQKKSNPTTMSAAREMTKAPRPETNKTRVEFHFQPNINNSKKNLLQPRRFHREAKNVKK